MPLDGTMVKNLSYILFGNLAYQIASFFSIIYLSRILGPGIFGIFNFAVAVVSYFTIFVTFGLDDFGILHVAPNREHKNIISRVGNLLGLRLVIAIVCYTALTLAVYLIPQFYNNRILFLILGLNLFISAFSTEWFFIAVEKIHCVAISKAASRLLYLVSILVLVTSSDDILLVASINILSGMIIAVALIFLFIRANKEFKIFFNIQQWSYILRFNFPLSVASIIGQIRMNADLVILGFLVSSNNLGFYAATLNLTNIGVLFCGLVRQVIFPKIIKSYQHGDFEKLRQINFIFIKYGVVIGLLIGFYGTFFADKIILVFFGSKFIQAKPALQIILWVVAVNFMGISLPHVLMTHNKKLYLLVNMYAGVINVILNFILIPYLGIKGAAYSYLFSTLFWIFSCYYSICISNQLFPMSLSKIFTKPLFSFFVCSIFFILFDVRISYIAIIFFTVIYLSALLATRHLSVSGIISDYKIIQ